MAIKDNTTQLQTILSKVKALPNEDTSGGITPSGTKTITTNGTHDVTNYASVLVNVSAGTTETWTFTMEDGSTVTKEVIVS